MHARGIASPRQCPGERMGPGNSGKGGLTFHRTKSFSQGGQSVLCVHRKRPGSA